MNLYDEGSDPSWKAWLWIAPLSLAWLCAIIAGPGWLKALALTGWLPVLAYQIGLDRGESRERRRHQSLR